MHTYIFSGADLFHRRLVLYLFTDSRISTHSLLPPHSWMPAAVCGTEKSKPVLKEELNACNQTNSSSMHARLQIIHAEVKSPKAHEITNLNEIRKQTTP